MAAIMVHSSHTSRYTTGATPPLTTALVLYTGHCSGHADHDHLHLRHAGQMRGASSLLSTILCRSVAGAHQMPIQYTLTPASLKTSMAMPAHETSKLSKVAQPGAYELPSHLAEMSGASSSMHVHGQHRLRIKSCQGRRTHDGGPRKDGTPGHQHQLLARRLGPDVLAVDLQRRSEACQGPARLQHSCGQCRAGREGRTSKVKMELTASCSPAPPEVMAMRMTCGALNGLTPCTIT